MAYRFSLGDVAFLTSAAGDDALRRAAELPLEGASLIGDLTRVRRVAGDHAGAVAETVRLRRLAQRRWGDGSSGGGVPGHTDGGDEVPGGAARGDVSSGCGVPGDTDGGDEVPGGAARGDESAGGGGPDGADGGDGVPDPIARRSPLQVGPGAGYARWLFTDTALQQAPPPVVAAYRAARIAERVGATAPGGIAAGRVPARAAGGPIGGVHDVTCSIGTDLAALLAAGVPAVGSDLHPVRLAMARHNLRRAGLPARLALADARTRTTRGLLRYADPARRDVTGRRIGSADTIPPVADLDAADPAHPPVLRLPPGIDYPALGRAGEIEIVSWDGAVREAVSWPPGLASAARRATVLAGRRIVEQLTDADPDDTSVTAVGDYLVDPDPAVVRAHLVRQYATRHRLTLLDEHLAYLTGAVPPPGIRSFRVLDQAPFTERTVRDWVRRDRVGTLEIKQRGTPVVPDELRRRVRPAGDTRIARSLVIARVGRGTNAFWCEAVPARRGATR